MPRALLFLLLAAVLGAVLGLAVLRSRGEGPVVEHVSVSDNRSAISRILGERAVETAPGSPAFFRWEPMEEDSARALFNQLANQSNRFDPNCYFRYRPNVELEIANPEHPDGRWTLRTNGLGLRNDGALLAAPDLRLLVTGDSHTDGICNNAEGFPARLAERLGPGVDVANTGKSGYSFYNYFGVLESFAALDPDLFVVCVYGGNDYAELLLPHHYHQRLPWPDPEFMGKEKLDAVREYLSAGVLPQGFMQATLFQKNPELEPLCAEAVGLLVDAIGERCAERGLPWVVVYIPSVLEVQRELYEPELSRAVADLELDERSLGAPERLTAVLFERLRARGVAVLDLRPVFRRQEGELYWRSDHHLNLAANELVAAELARLIESL